MCCNNHPLKYHNIHLVGYNSAIILKSQSYGKILYYSCVEKFLECMLHNLYDIDDNITIMIVVLIIIIDISYHDANVFTVTLQNIIKYDLL